MGSRGSSSYNYASTARQNVYVPQIAADPPQIVPTAQMAKTANNANFKADDDSAFHALYNGQQYFVSQAFDIDQQIALMNYLSMDTEGGTLYSMSQNLNYAMANGQRLTANQQFVKNTLEGAMHNLGYNVFLYRYDHDSMINTIMRNIGARGSYENFTEAQLKSMLVGQEYSESKFLSTSYNDFKNAADASTFTSRAVRIVYEAPARTQALMPGNGPGGRLGEILLAPNQKSTITDVVYTGKSARRQGTQSYTQKQIEIHVRIG